MLITNPLVLGALSLVVVLLAITVHEFAHSLSSNLLGDDTAKQSGRLTLNPLKHVDLFTTLLLPILLVIAGYPPFGAAKPVPFNPYKLKYAEFGSAIVGFAGPLSNMLLAVLGGVVLRFTVGAIHSSLWLTWWWLFIIVNVGFFVFNLIPIPPLDGSRVLYAFSPGFLQDIMAKIESFGILTVVVFMIFLFPAISPILQTVDDWLIRILVGG